MHPAKPFLASKSAALASVSWAPVAPGEGGDEVGHDRVVVARVEGDVGAAARGQGAGDVERRVAIEGGHLDGHHGLDLEERSPEGLVQDPSADGRLEVEAEERD